MSTYTSGYDLTATRDITCNDIALMCTDLDAKFNDYFSSDQYRFVPEAITEGGILMWKWPGKIEHGDDHRRSMYKTMRITFRRGWPWIRHDYDCRVEKWLGDNTVICRGQTDLHLDGGIPLYSTGNSRLTNTFLKAFHGAPSWTGEELQLFEACLAKIGMVRKGRYPTKSSLTVASVQK